MMKYGIFGCLIIVLLCACVMPENPGEARRPFDPDLYAWKTASWTPFAVEDSIAGFAYAKINNSDRYVAVSYSGVIGWSNDGDIWHRAVAAEVGGSSASPNPFNASFNAVACGDGVFIAVGNDGKIARSTDGIAWTALGHSGGISGFGASNIMGIAWGFTENKTNGAKTNMFVAVGGYANIAYSLDGGLTWAECKDPSGNFGTSQLNAIAFDPGGARFYIGGSDGKRGWSDDPRLKNWHHKGGEHPFYGNSIRKITVGRYEDKIGIGIAFDEYDYKRITIATNADFGDLDSDLDAGGFGDNAITGIAFGSNVFVAAGSSAMIGWWPSDNPQKRSDRYWRALSFTEFQWWEISALAALKDRFFAGGVGGKIGYSK